MSLHPPAWTSAHQGSDMTRLNSPWRWPTAALLLLDAAAHTPLIRPHLAEAPYIGVLFILLTAACILLTAAVITIDTAATWATIHVVCLLALAAFLISRTVGLPQIGDDVGNWTEPLEYPALTAEVLTAVIATIVLNGYRHGAQHHGERSEETPRGH